MNKPVTDTVVNTFFVHLTTFLDSLHDMAIDHQEITAYFARPSLRAAHSQVAQRHLAKYQAATADILLTAAQLAQISSPVAQELLVDWITAAPELVIARLLPQP